MAVNVEGGVPQTHIVPAPSRLSWGAIFGGAVAALGIWVLLYSLGLAVGLSSIDPNNPGSLRGSGIFTGIWSALVPLVALFVGGLVAGRGAGVQTRVGGATHGLVMWGLTTLLGASLIVSALASVARGAASLGGAAVQAGGAAVGSAARQAPRMGDLAEQLGLDPNAALRPLNERLQAEGKPPVTPQQLESTLRDVGRQVVQTGEIDRQSLVQSIAQNTALDPQDAEDLAGRIETQVNESRERLSGTLQEAQTRGLQAVEATGRAFWGVFAALLLGLISAVFGGIVGVTPRQRLPAKGEAVVAGREERRIPVHP